MEIQEEQTSYKKVKVRVNLSGSRYVGYVRVYSPKTRISDVLNEKKQFMTLLEVDSMEPIEKGALLVINKNLISYVQAMEEFKRNYSVVHTGRFVGVKVRAVEYQIGGEVFLPAHIIGEDPAEFLSLTPYFLNVKNASIKGTSERYNFMAVSKNQIRSIEIGHSG